MKNLKLSISILIIVFTFQFSSAQKYAMVDISNTEVVSSVPVVDAPSIDRTGIVELSNYIKSQAIFPIDELNYANEAKVDLQISINKDGVINDVRQITGNKRIGKVVLKSLKSLHRVTPILVNGVATSKTIHLPLIFKL